MQTIQRTDATRPSSSEKPDAAASENRRPFSPRRLHDRSARFHLKFDATVALMMEMGRAEDQDAKGVEGLLTNPIM
jgi:hypothetical protein